MQSVNASVVARLPNYRFRMSTEVLIVGGGIAGLATAYGSIASGCRFCCWKAARASAG
jgi:cation diffusion facilitator CzcD-associated flavoprotein CzcO